MIEMAPQLLRHILANLPALLIRDFLLDVFTETERTPATLVGDATAIPHCGAYIYAGKILAIDGTLYGVSGVDGIRPGDGTPVSVYSLDIAAGGLLSLRNSKITLQPGDIANYTGTEPLHTTLGRLLLNYGILVAPFGTLIEYINADWNIGKIEAEYIFEALRTDQITVEQVKHYSRNLHYIGHFTELSVPSFTERSLTVDPKIIARRDELLKQYHTEIAAGDAVVMQKIEAELIAMDRASLKGDVSTLFYDRDNKSYEIHRKAMFIMGGMVPEFGDKGYGFIGNSLEEGWEVDKFPIINNEIRRGSFNRAKETAKGGEQTKFIIRVFQNTQITEEDCHSQQYLHVQLTKDLAKQYLYRNIVVDGAIITLTADNMAHYVGQTVAMRSSLYCRCKTGYCFTCMGELFRSIDQEGLTMSAVTISSSFTRASLKAKHSSKTKAVSITSLNRYVV